MDGGERARDCSRRTQDEEEEEEEQAGASEGDRRACVECKEGRDGGVDNNNNAVRWPAGWIVSR